MNQRSKESVLLLQKSNFLGTVTVHLLLKSERTSTRGAKRKSKVPRLFFSEARRSFALFFQTEKKLVRPPSLTQFPRESNQGRRSLPHIFLVYVSLKRRLAALRWKIEAVFSRMKNFRSIKCTYRHKLQFHRLIFMTLVAVYNTEVTIHPLKK